MLKTSSACSRKFFTFAAYPSTSVRTSCTLPPLIKNFLSTLLTETVSFLSDCGHNVALVMKILSRVNTSSSRSSDEIELTADADLSRGGMIFDGGADELFGDFEGKSLGTNSIASADREDLFGREAFGTNSIASGDSEDRFEGKPFGTKSVASGDKEDFPGRKLFGRNSLTSGDSGDFLCGRSCGKNSGDSGYSIHSELLEFLRARALEVLLAEKVRQTKRKHNMVKSRARVRRACNDDFRRCELFCCLVRLLMR